jgi:hypothetical protein
MEKTKKNKSKKNKSKKNKSKRLKNVNEMIDDVTIVVARFNEDISWLNKPELKDITHIIYNKGNEIKDFDSIKLPNVGREAQTFIQHIIDNYDRLSDITIFLPGSCMDDHKITKTNETLTLALKTKDTVFIGQEFRENIMKIYGNRRIDEWSGTNEKNIENLPSKRVYPAKLRPFEKWYDHYIGKKIITRFICWTAIFAVSREDILQKPKSYYEELNDCLNKDSNPEEGHYMEMSWVSVFGKIAEKCLYSGKRIEDIKKDIKLLLPYETPALAIIVAYKRSDEKYLNIFINYMMEYLKGFKYKIFIIDKLKNNIDLNEGYDKIDDHDDDEGKLLNIGFKIAKKENYSYFMFHNIKLLPSIELKRHYVEYRDIISNLGNVMKREKNKNKNKIYFGEVVAFAKSIFEAINGYSNDKKRNEKINNDLLSRIKENNYYIINPFKGGYLNGVTREKEERDKIIDESIIKSAKETWKEDGLSNLQYNVENVIELNKNCSIYEVK